MYLLFRIKITTVRTCFHLGHVERKLHEKHVKRRSDLETVFLLDQVQKGLGDKLTKDAINYLRKHKLVEGRVNSLYLSAEVSKTIDASAEYIKNKAFDDQYYKDLIINYLRQYGRAQKKDFRTLLMDKLPNSLSERQKEYKIGNLLASLKRQGLIRTDSSNQQLSFWILE